MNIFEGAVVKSTPQPAIYHPQRGTLNITGATIEGYIAVGMKSGTLNVKDSTLTGTGNETGAPDSWSKGDGIQYDGSAIFIDSAVGYDGAMNITIVDSTLTSEHAYAVKEIKGSSMEKSNILSLTITGNSVLNKCTDGVGSIENNNEGATVKTKGINVEDDSAVKITGGTFNFDPTTYVDAESCNVTKDSDTDSKTWTVSAKTV